MISPSIRIAKNKVRTTRMPCLKNEWRIRSLVRSQARKLLFQQARFAKKALIIANGAT
jgi:hypothetical protein